MDASSNVKYFTFYDLETYGLDPRSDRIAQFAAVRTDSSFNILEKTVIYCLPQQDYIPNVESMLVTGITPESVETLYRKDAYRENEFINRVIGFLTRPDNCVLGYNNVKFDDEYLRFTAFRNFYDPYAFNSSPSNNSTRWDLVYLVRACYALSPEEINWPQNPEGSGVSMRLEHMSKANSLEHGHAHDALSDVEATVQLAKLIHDRKPKLFNYFFNLRTKRSIEETFYDSMSGRFIKSPLVHVDTGYGPETLYTGVILPVYLRNDKGSSIYGWRLDQELDSLFKLASSPEQALAEDLDLRQLGLVKINTARCPALSEYSVIAKRPQRAARLNIDLKKVAANLEYIESHDLLAGLMDRMIVLEKNRFAASADPAEPDPEHMLYSLFSLSPEDRRNKNIIHEREAKDPFVFDEINFSNSTLRRLLFRYKARNFSQYLNDREAAKWNERIVSYLDARAPVFQQQIEEAVKKHAGDVEKLKILLSIIRYYSRDGWQIADEQVVADLTDMITALEEKKKSAAENNNNDQVIQKSSTQEAVSSESAVPQTAQPE